jgi:hypothetical protein
VLATASLATDPAAWIVSLLGLAICLARSLAFKKATGRNPWRMPVWLWAVIGVFTGLIGMVLAFIATRPSAMLAAQVKGPATGYGPPPTAYPPPTGYDPSDGYGMPPVSYGERAAAGADGGGVAPPGWYPNPDNPSQRGYWDGQTWTGRARWDGQAWVPES